jgi:hypothetical protein
MTDATVCLDLVLPFRMVTSVQPAHAVAPHCEEDW